MNSKTVVLQLILPLCMWAQTTHHHYVAIDLGTLGGPGSSGCVPDCRLLNNSGGVVFHSDTSATDPFPDNPFGDGNVQLAVHWQNGFARPLVAPAGAGLPSFGLWVNDTGAVAGFAENGQLDPTTGNPVTLAALWYFGVPINLGTLGGYGSLATAVNNYGQVVGVAANNIPDPFADAFYNHSPIWYPVSTQTHAFLWQAGVMRDLGTLGGTDSVAQSINQAGQVAGYSFTNMSVNSVTGLPTLHPFLWERGAMTDLGTLGGTLAVATGLGDDGRVIGYSNMAGDATAHPFIWDRNGMVDLKTLGGDNGTAYWLGSGGHVVGQADLSGSKTFHAFLWQNGKINDLGTVDGDPCSIAFGVNASGQVAGDSGAGSQGGRCVGKGHPFFWENGEAVDLNKFTAPLESGLRLTGLCCINDAGEMLGTGNLPNGTNRGMVLLPCDANHPNLKGCDYSLAFTKP